MEKILGTIITIILVFYLLRFLFALIMPFIMRRFINNVAKKMGQQGGTFYYGQQPEYNKNVQEGEVTIDNPQQGQRHKETTFKERLDGEYVDFEEVKDK